MNQFLRLSITELCSIFNRTGAGTRVGKDFCNVADPDDFGPDPKTNFEKKPDTEQTLKKNADPDPALCKILY
jgi:hypothetical protein